MPDSHADPSGAAREVWLELSDLVLDNTRRRDVADEIGMSFGLSRALRRLARRSMSMRELADALDIDPPNATAVVDKLERRQLVARQPHPEDRRAKLVVITPAGAELAARANAILATPPAPLAALPADDLATLRQILARLRSDVPAPGDR